MIHPGLGRIHREDQRDENYGVQRLLSRTPAQAEDAPRLRYWWDRGWWGNQGYSPQCVAYAWLHWLEDGPVTHEDKSPGADPLLAPTEVYSEAQQVDEWPGDSYDGTSVRAGAKVLQRHGLIGNYYWAWDLPKLINSIRLLGPVVVGTWWYDQMFWPDDNYFVRVGGSRVGGHAYLINGVNGDEGKFRIKNSWGRAWGDKGRAWITFEDMERLIREQGEVCIAEEWAP